MEELVRRAFADAPVMIEIARCESGFRQFGPDGTVLRGRLNPQDIGIFQINEGYHQNAASRLGFNIFAVAGNLAYARRLYNQNGFRDWSWSEECWGG